MDTEGDFDSAQARDDAADQNRALKEIHRIAVRLAAIPSIADLEIVLADELRSTTGAMAVTFGEFREEDRSLVLRCIRTDSGNLERFLKATGIDPGAIVSRVDVAGFEEMLAARVAYRDSLAEVTFGQVPLFISKIVHRLFKIDKYLGISYLYEGKLYGTSVLVFRAGDKLPREDFLTAFSALAAVSLRRRTTESELAESGLRYRSIVTNVPLIFLVIDGMGRVEVAEGLGLGLIGVDAARVVGKSMVEVFRGYPEVVSHIRRALSGERLNTRSFVRDRTYEVMYAPVQREDSSVKSVICVAHDVTERAKAEKEVRRLNEGLERMVEERSSKLVLAEKMATLGQLVTGIAHELNTPVAAIQSSARRTLEGLEGGLIPVLEFYQSLDDRRRTLFEELYETARKRRSLAAGGPSREERADRRRIAATLAERGLEGSEALVDVLADIGALGKVDELGPALSDPQTRDLVRRVRSLAGFGRALEVIEASATKAAKVVEALRLYASLDSTQTAAPLDVAKSLDTVLTLYNNLIKRVVVVRSYDPDSVATGKADELERVWVNLINNALQAMSYKGRLELRTERRGDEIFVVVGDDGPGVPDDIAPRIFEPFFSTKGDGEGIGLGLDIARKIVENHRGSIGFESKPGRTFFTVRLPTGERKAR